MNNRNLMEYVMFGRISNPMKNLQQAADDAGTIAETVETLSKLLDKFHEDHGVAIGAQLQMAWPEAEHVTPVAAKAIYRLERSLTPPED